MPDLVLPPIATAPPAPGAVGAAAHGFPAAAGLAPTDQIAGATGAAGFVARLQAAFALLAGGLTGAQTSPAAALMAGQGPAASDQPAPLQADDARGTDREQAPADQELMALLAALGLTASPVGVASETDAKPAAGPTDDGGMSVQAVSASSRAALAEPIATAGERHSDAPLAAGANVASTMLASAPPATQARDLPAAADVSTQAPSSPASPTTADAAAPVPSAPVPALPAQPQPTASSAADAAASPSVPAQATAPTAPVVQATVVDTGAQPAESTQSTAPLKKDTPAAERVTPAGRSAPQATARIPSAAGQQASDAGQRSDARDSASSDARSSVFETSAEQAAAQPAADGDGLRAQMAQGGAVSGAQPQHLSAAQPTEVASQIARHAELYRLPGGHGVRIQLQPEGLGTVDVTVRYGPGHTVEMHLAVDSATTGALVQAGWTDLRDALVAQGFSADRLVISVAAPAAETNGSPFGQDGSGRSDAGAMAFGQQSGGRQDGGDAARPSQGGGIVDPSLQPESTDEPSSVGQTSRIDYRV